MQCTFFANQGPLSHPPSHYHTTANALACSTIDSPIDYCNSLPAGVNIGKIKRVQRIQNNAAKVVYWNGRRNAAILLLQKLHWLPIAKRIDYEVALLTWNAQSHLYDPLPIRPTYYMSSVPHETCGQQAKTNLLFLLPVLYKNCTSWSKSKSVHNCKSWQIIIMIIIIII